MLAGINSNCEKQNSEGKQNFTAKFTNSQQKLYFLNLQIYYQQLNKIFMQYLFVRLTHAINFVFISLFSFYNDYCVKILFKLWSMKISEFLPRSIYGRNLRAVHLEMRNCSKHNFPNISLHIVPSIRINPIRS